MRFIRLAPALSDEIVKSNARAKEWLRLANCNQLFEISSEFND
jgi:hypothetical protein